MSTPHPECSATTTRNVSEYSPSGSFPPIGVWPFRPYAIALTSMILATSFLRSSVFLWSNRTPLAIMRKMATTIHMPRDPNTLSNYNNWITKHTKAELTIDFKNEKLTGNVTLDLESITESESEEIILDSSYLNVTDISLNGVKTRDWIVKDRVEPYGSPLSIKIPGGKAKSETVSVNIAISTTSQCTALQWLTLTQTKGPYPYMFSQCQAIHNRSLFPCQDTPDVKSTYEFLISSPLPVITSGVPVDQSQTADQGPKTEKPIKYGEDIKTYHFIQKIPMPSYLFSLASGDIVTAPIGPRSVVATTPGKDLAEAKWELERDVEKFIEVAEELIFPYVWGQYNVLVLPASFPYGGMENPIFTFATPTIISGDRENVDVIAHELSHSWSGNLVSNASWEHFWLNEGWTTYMERRIQAAIYGESRRDFSAIIGWKALEDSVALFGPDHEFTKLVIDLKGQDPDDAFSSIPYEKGFHFLYYLEKVVGKPVFDKFIPHYFTTWQKTSLDSYEFKSTLLKFFESDKTASKALAEVDWDTWFYKPGLPPKPKFDTSMADKCYALADKWEFQKDFKPSPSDIDGWTGNQIIVFLEKVQLFANPLSPTQSQAMGAAYSLFNTRNVELSSRYFGVGLSAQDTSVYEPTVDLLGKVGRMKFVRPLYRQLAIVDKDLALKTFEKNKDFYHPICKGLVEKDLQETQGKK